MMETLEAKTESMNSAKEIESGSGSGTDTGTTGEYSSKRGWISIAKGFFRVDKFRA